MSEAPALPAQTPGMLVGGGGSGSALSGECAAAVADAGLSPADFGSSEAVTESIEAAAGRCNGYREARWLEQVEREFDAEEAGRQEEEQDRSRLRGRPNLRQRHLQQCVSSPIVDSRFFRSSPDDPSTNVAPGPGQSPPGALGYDPLAALAGPHYVGPTMQTAVLAVVSALDDPLVERPPRDLTRRRPAGTALTEQETQQVVRQCISGILGAAAHEDRPRLRRFRLSEARRPRNTESERREAERERPSPPTLAETAQPSAEGVAASDDEASDAPDGETGHSASGCIEASAESNVTAMREEVQAEHATADTAAEQEIAQEELSARREMSRASGEYASRSGEAQTGGLDASPGSARAQVAGNRAALALAGAVARRAVALARAAAGPAMGEQAMLLQQNGQTSSPEISGQVPALGTAPRTPVRERTTCRDD